MAITPSTAQKEAQAQADAKKQAQEQLRLDYRGLFNSDKGKNVLRDLKKRFGWKNGGDVESPSYRFGMSHADSALTEGMKEPVRHILAMTEQTASTEPKPTRAIQ